MMVKPDKSLINKIEVINHLAVFNELMLLIDGLVFKSFLQDLFVIFIQRNEPAKQFVGLGIHFVNIVEPIYVIMSFLPYVL